jgi:hypothetical protein
MSDQPVAERLQVKGERRLAVIGASAALEKTVGAAKARADLAKAEVVLLFASDRAGLEAKLPDVLKTIPDGAILWVAYPKLSSKLAAHLSRDIIHALAPKHGLHREPDRDRRGLVGAAVEAGQVRSRADVNASPPEKCPLQNGPILTASVLAETRLQI